jgi:carboxylesterase type B
LIQRLNIFGFPNSAALQQQNLGLEDIRFAVEWIRENIEAFGGNPDQMTLWGQSAGSIAVNAWTYSYLEDPIVSGTISTSGTALAPREGWQSFDYQQSNFSFVAGLSAPSPCFWSCSDLVQNNLAALETLPSSWNVCVSSRL